MNPSMQGGQQPGILDQVKSFLMGSGILHNLANPSGSMAPSGMSPQPLTSSPVSIDNKGIFSNPKGISPSQADAIEKQARIQQAQAAALAAGGNPNAILAAPQRKRKAAK